MDDGAARSRIVLGLLESVERDGRRTQRHRASEFGVALGLVNAYLNYCINRGFVKVKKIPAQRYFYYLTPKGFAEKSKLTITLISNSLAFFRAARADYSAAFREFAGRGMTRIVLVGMSDLAEIAMICATENGIVLVGIIDSGSDRSQFAGLAILGRFDEIPGGFNGAVITDLTSPQATYDAAVAELGIDCVIAPVFLASRAVASRRPPNE
jgi:hypothetical protein